MCRYLDDAAVQLSKFRGTRVAGTSISSRHEPNPVVSHELVPFDSGGPH